MRKYSLLFLFLLSFTFTKAASKDSTRYTRQLSLLVDNDVFTSLYRDQYYSSGLFGIYSWLYQADSINRKTRSVALVQRIYTPRYVTDRLVTSFDRPYAGQIAIQLSQTLFRENFIWKNQLELGWMGPGSLTGQIQVNWHNTLGLPEPRGWQFEIQNSPIINYNGTFANSIWRRKSFEIISETNLSTGTAFNYLREEIIFRTGQLKNLRSSVQYNGQLGNSNPRESSELTEEIVVFYSPGIEYNFYNSTIEGNIFGRAAPHTETPIRWIIQHRFGLLFSWKGFDFTINYYRRSKETEEAILHQYAGILLARRF